MKNLGIYDGDLIAVHKTVEVKPGDVVVARIDEEVTVKRFRRGNAKHIVELHPENSIYDPIFIDLRVTSFNIEGLSVGVIRRNISYY